MTASLRPAFTLNKTECTGHRLGGFSLEKTDYRGTFKRGRTWFSRHGRYGDNFALTTNFISSLEFDVAYTILRKKRDVQQTFCSNKRSLNANLTLRLRKQFVSRRVPWELMKTAMVTELR